MSQELSKFDKEKQFGALTPILLPKKYEKKKQ